MKVISADEAGCEGDFRTKQRVEEKRWEKVAVGRWQRGMRAAGWASGGNWRVDHSF